MALCFQNGAPSPGKQLCRPRGCRDRNCACEPMCHGSEVTQDSFPWGLGSQEAQSQMVMSASHCGGCSAVIFQFPPIFHCWTLVIPFMFQCCQYSVPCSTWVWDLKSKPPQILPGSKSYLRASVGDEAAGRDSCPLRVCRVPLMSSRPSGLSPLRPSAGSPWNSQMFS